MKKIGFIKNWEKLQENYRDNSLGFENEIEKFYTYLNLMPSANAILGFIGKFGTGKSNLLEGVKKKSEMVDKWIQFDAWKYPERNYLWENFTIEISKGLYPNQYKKFSNRVDGKSPIKEKLDLFIDAFSALIHLLSPGLGVVPSFAWKLFGGYKQNDSLKRLHELQSLVGQMLKRYSEENSGNIYIVIEDIDRSSDSGIFFLETLNYFFRNSFFSNKIIAIVPVGNIAYIDNIDSYSKCLDFMYFSQLPNPDMYNFVDDVFDENDLAINANAREQVVRFLVELINLPDGNMRKIKLLLRDAAITYKRNSGEDKYDWRMVIAFVAMKYFKANKEGFEGSYAQYFQNRYIELNVPFSRLFLAIVRGARDLNPSPQENTVRFKFKENNSALPVIYAPSSVGQQTEGELGLHYQEIMTVR